MSRLRTLLTYICEQIFPHMKYTKNKITKILDKHLENILRITTTCIKLGIDELVSKKTRSMLKI